VHASVTSRVVLDIKIAIFKDRMREAALSGLDINDVPTPVSAMNELRHPIIDGEP
jgi:hypothetical protein